MLKAIPSCVALSLIVAAGAAGREIGPEADWCRAVNEVPPSEELILRPGDYAGPCTVRRSGSESMPFVIRGSDPARPPRIVYLGTGDNVLNVRASNLLLKGLGFGPTLPSVDAIRLYGVHNVTIENCTFSDLGGIAIVANHANFDALTIRKNQIVRSRETAVYLGCHDGISCKASALLLEENSIHGVDAPAGEIGYGIQIKLNSTAAIRSNVVTDTKGPGIMVYGATDVGASSLIERNFVAGSRTSSAIVLGGGPAFVRNNIAVGSAEAGIALEDYRRRSLLRGIVVAHNTVYGNAGGGIVVPGSGRLDVRIFNNAVHARPNTRALPLTRTGLFAAGNVDCSLGACFHDPANGDFSPLPGSLLVGRAWPDLGVPSADYVGTRRTLTPTVGAIELSR